MAAAAVTPPTLSAYRACLDGNGLVRRSPAHSLPRTPPGPPPGGVVLTRLVRAPAPQQSRARGHAKLEIHDMTRTLALNVTASTWLLIIGASLAFAAAPEIAAPAATAHPTTGAATTAPSADAAAAAAARIDVDTSEVPEMNDYGLKVKALAEEWYPKVIERLAVRDQGFTPPQHVVIRFRKMRGVAYTGGDRVTCSADYFTKHPDDLGAIVHELVHVVQQYHDKSVPGWLTEGIADDVRFFT